MKVIMYVWERSRCILKASLYTGCFSDQIKCYSDPAVKLTCCILHSFMIFQRNFNAVIQTLMLLESPSNLISHPLLPPILKTHGLLTKPWAQRECAEPRRHHGGSEMSLLTSIYCWTQHTWSEKRRSQRWNEAPLRVGSEARQPSAFSITGAHSEPVSHWLGDHYP